MTAGDGVVDAINLLVDEVAGLKEQRDALRRQLAEARRWWEIYQRSCSGNLASDAAAQSLTATLAEVDQ